MSEGGHNQAKNTVLESSHKFTEDVMNTQSTQKAIYIFINAIENRRYCLYQDARNNISFKHSMILEYSI